MTRKIFATAAMLIALPAGSNAQGWHADVQVGKLRSTLDPTVEATQSLGAGLGYDDSLTAFRLSAGGNTQGASSNWGAVALSKRLAAHSGAVSTGMDLAGNGFVVQNRTPGAIKPGGLFTPPTITPSSTTSGNAVAISALPLIGFGRDKVQFLAHGGVSYYNASIAGQQRDRTVGLADAQLTIQENPNFSLIPVVRAFKAQNESGSTFGGISALASQDRVSFWASVGQWFASPDSASSSKVAWQLGGSLRLSDRAAVNASARHDAFDPLYLNPPQTSWSIGLSIALGPVTHRVAAPIPAAYHSGRATIKLPASAAANQPALSIAGDFNNWTPAPMQREGDSWIYTIAIAPGVYNYAFVASNGDFFVPTNVPGRKDDGMGGQVAVLVVQ